MRVFVILLACLAAKSFAFTIEQPADCQTEPVLETYVEFYLPKSLEGNNDLVQKLNLSIETSNTILRNSCIPVRRTISKISYHKTLDELNFDRVRFSMVQLMIADPALYGEVVSDKVYTFKGIVLENHNSESIRFFGNTSPVEYPNVFLISSDCDFETVEHEMGHLHGLNHEKEIVPGRENLADRRAYAALCAGGGTVMSYADKRIPIYSSPKIKVDGEVCGPTPERDNAAVIRGYYGLN